MKPIERITIHKDNGIFARDKARVAACPSPVVRATSTSRSKPRKVEAGWKSWRGDDDERGSVARVIHGEYKVTRAIWRSLVAAGEGVGALSQHGGYGPDVAMFPFDTDRRKTPLFLSSFIILCASARTVSESRGSLKN